jgi:hypothetical protein
LCAEPLENGVPCLAANCKEYSICIAKKNQGGSSTEPENYVLKEPQHLKSLTNYLKELWRRASGISEELEF